MCDPRRPDLSRTVLQSLAASPHHGLVATTSADGTAVLSSGIRALRKRRIRGHYNQKIFRLDFKRETGELRMWDNLRTEVSGVYPGPHGVESARIISS